MAGEILKKADERMKKTIESFRKELASIRTGRASVALVENINVEYYGTRTPIKQLANLSTPDPKQIAIQPYDKNAAVEIDKALQKSDLGAMPKVEGGIIRVMLPPLTEERRKDLVKIIKKHSEDSKVSIRNIRRDAIEEAKAKKDKKQITQDQEKHVESE
ncbi:MAG: ribosome recycling factor, partial [Candidatus Margulisiibacteriota bacterium]